MPKFTDTQSVLLSAASQRADQSFYHYQGPSPKVAPASPKRSPGW